MSLALPPFGPPEIWGPTHPRTNQLRRNLVDLGRVDLAALVLQVAPAKVHGHVRGIMVNFMEDVSEADHLVAKRAAEPIYAELVADDPTLVAPPMLTEHVVLSDLLDCGNPACPIHGRTL